MGRTYAEVTSRYNHRARLVAVAGGTRAEGLAADYGVDFEPSVERLMAWRDVNAVVLTPPEQAHLEYTRMAFPIDWSIPVVRDRPWYADPDGGLFLSQCVHNLDMMRWLVGSEARQVYAHVASHGGHGLPNLSIMAQVAFDSSARRPGRCIAPGTGEPS